MKFTPFKFVLFSTLVLMSILLTLGVANAASTTRANGKIAFTSDRDGNSEIYLMNADGSGQTRLTYTPEREDYPTWSPDGQQILFMKEASGNFSINVMSCGGNNARLITTLSGELYGMSWSPDATKIAFQDGTDIFTIGKDGTNRVNLTAGQFFNFQPSWSPDGLRIAFTRADNSSIDIYTMDLTGGDIRRVTFPGGAWDPGSDSPDWSPDGGLLAIRTGDPDQGNSLALVGPNGSAPQFILYSYNFYPEYINQPKWSPDGMKFVFYGSGDSGSQIWTINQDGTGLALLTATSSNNSNPDWQPLAPAVNVTTVEELYAAVNNLQNAGTQVVATPGVYILSTTDQNGNARPNGGRLELQDNMSLIGVIGDRSAVVIDAAGMPTSAFNNAAPLPLVAAVRVGKGTNAVEWLTVKNTVNGNANIGTDLVSANPAVLRVAHVASTNSQRGLDVRNLGAAMINRVIVVEIIDNDFFNNRIGLQGEGFRIASQQGANGASIFATLSGNRSYNNYLGLLVENNRSNSANTKVFSSGDRFYENGNGALVGAALSSNATVANGNNVSFTALGDTFENNNGVNNFDYGGLIVIGGENTSIVNGTSNNTVTAELRGCRFGNNQLYDLQVIGVRSNPVSVGLPGTNNHATVKLYGTQVPTLAVTNSFPDTPGGSNTASVIRTAAFDFDGDGRADIAGWRDTGGLWSVMNSASSTLQTLPFGMTGDRIVPGDYDGDGKSDYAVWRPSTGFWYLQQSSFGYRSYQFGLPTDLPVQGDFDGDGRTDIAVVRPFTGTWYLQQSTAGFAVVQFGMSGDKPVAGDYDGDGRSDIAVYRPSDGYWYQLRSSLGYTSVHFGISTDEVAPADYDGDGKTDLAVYRDSTGTWYLQQSTAGFAGIQFGSAGDVPAVGDFDGDGRADISVFRPSNATWYRINSLTNIAAAAVFGQGSDKPVASAAVPVQ